MATKIKSIAKYFMAMLCIALSLCCVYGMRAFFNEINPGEDTPTIQTQTNNLTLNSGFTDNQYIVGAGGIYKYLSSNGAVQTQSVNTNSLQFNNNTLELIFLKDSITQLSSFSLTEQNIASVLQATKTSDNVDINILYSEGTANITTSHDAEYILGTMALNANSTLNYLNGEFEVGGFKGATSFTAATSSTEAKILHLKGGSFTLSGNITYNAKKANCRAFLQTGGTLTLDGPTITGFAYTEEWGSILYINNGTFNFNSGIIGSSKEELATEEDYANGGTALIHSFPSSETSNVIVNLNGGIIGNNFTNCNTLDFSGYNEESPSTHVNMLGTIIQYNYADYDALIYTNYYCDVVLDGSVITNNEAEYNIIWDEEGGSTFNMISGSIISNKVGESIINVKEVTITGGEFEQNECIRVIEAEDIELVEVSFYDNICHNALIETNSWNNVDIYMNSCMFKGNLFTYLLYSENFTTENHLVNIDIYNTTIAQNTCNASLIEAYNPTGELNIGLTGCEITENDVGSYLLYNENGTVWVDTVNITKNSFGSMMLYPGELVNIDNVDISENVCMGEIIYSEFTTELILSDCIIYNNDFLDSANVILLENQCNIDLRGDKIYIEAEGSVQYAITTSGRISFSTDNVNILPDTEGDANDYIADVYLIYTEPIFFNVGLSHNISVYKQRLTSFDDGDIYTSHIAYCGTPALLEPIKNNITVVNYQTYHQHSTTAKTYHLVCEYKKYDITFDGNAPSGATVTLPETSISVKYNSDVNLAGCSYMPTCTGYTFNGYYTATTGGTQVFNQDGMVIAEVSGFTDEAKRWIGTENKTVYAQWQDANPAGLFNAKTGELIYTWQQLIDNGYITISGTTITAFDTSLIGKLVIDESITGIGNGAFSDRSNLTGINIPNSVTSIGQNAFYNCSNLTGDLVIPNSVTSIGQMAFYNCSGLTGDLVIPNSVTSIKGMAFYGCSGFTGTLTISNSVTSIEAGVFGRCSGFTGTLTIPSSVTSIGNSAFSNCSNFTGTLTIPSGVTSIGDAAFDGCGNLTGDLIIPNSVTSLGSRAFNFCSGFNGKLTISNGLTIIPKEAFACANFTDTLTIPDGVISIGDFAFWSCTFTGNLVIPNTVTSIGASAFTLNKGLTSVDIQGSLISIGDSAFDNCRNVLEYDFTNHTSVPTLGSNAFAEINDNCKIYVPANLYNEWVSATNWSKYADYIVAVKPTGLFDSTTGEQIYTWQQLKDNGYITISDTTITAFNTSLTGKLIIDEGITSIGNSAFNCCVGLTSVTIPNSVISIGEDSFNACENLTRVEIPNSVTVIGSGAFNYCISLTSITIPNGVTSIASETFYDCRNVLEYNFTDHETVPTLSASAFFGINDNCKIYVPASLYGEWVSATNWSKYADYIVAVKQTGLFDSTTGEQIYTWQQLIDNGYITISGTTISDFNTSLAGKLVISDDITIISGGAFSDCVGLTSVTIPNGVISIGDSAFSCCSNLTSVIIPESVAIIEDYAFEFCGLTNLTIPNGVTSIGMYAFVGCESLISVTIGSSVTNIGYYSFSSCSNVLEYDFTNHTSVPTLGSNAFAEINDNCKIYVPANLYNEWVSATNWTTYADYIVPVGDVEPEPEQIAPGLYDSDTGEQIYTWQQLIDLNKISVTDGALQGNDATMAGKLVIDDSVTALNANAFKDYTGLTEVYIPKSVTSIVSYAFSGCSRLTSVYIPNSVTSIESYAFSDTLLLSITIPNSVISIGDYAFYHCSGLTNVVVGNSVTRIGNAAFRVCSRLTSITIPNSVTSIGSYAFFSCSGLTNVVVGNSVTSIGSSAFSTCENVLAYYFLDHTSVPTLGSAAFAEINDNCKIYVPISLYNEWVSATNWITYADYIRTASAGLYNASTGDEIYSWQQLIDNGYITISGTTITHCDNLSGALAIPDGITIIGDNAFNGCSGLTIVTIPSSVTSIGNSAFSGCTGLASVSIPSSVTSIGDSAFSGCSNILNYYFTNHTSVPTLGTNAFTNINANCKITVPSTTSVYDNWIAATNWVTWKSYITKSSGGNQCVSADTLVLLADGTSKRIDELTYDDMVMVWNFETGTYDVAPISIIFYHGHKEHDIINLRFSDGTILKIINTHGLFSVEDNNYVYITIDNVEDYIGKQFVKYKNGKVVNVTLVDYNVTVEYTGSYCLQTAGANNYIAGDMFSLTKPDIEGWFDYFTIGEGMKYDEAKMQEDIKKYGLYTYEDLAYTGITYEQFLAFNGPYLKVLVGRGVLTIEQIEALIDKYL